MSIFRKILLALVCLVIAAISTWLKFGNPEDLKRWLAGLSVPRIERAAAPAAPPQEEELPVHVVYGGGGASARETVLVLHFRRADSSDEVLAKAVISVQGADGSPVKEVSAWGAFRSDPRVGASVARFAVGTLPPGTYRVSADIGSRQSLGIRKAAMEFAARDAEPVWVELTKSR
ncbi:hypothetical protein A6A04_19935 [Paramagnetospirillum marisnigri]|uniref:Uncharacterized protein n=1 Tax=Paramagnetospirillum marisnigri TaxID=1285242 RepID=A0A178MJ70_9PROT|nr:hypothetical protein [Paramagnetospirillum marisnigri]OAN48700.1 hypothetical protein A6A04_19935 [Paramagnetospirillum marisnigri]